MNEKDTFHTVTMKKDISLQRVMDLICTGMEGGIGYWSQISGYIDPVPVPEKSLMMEGEKPFRHNEWPVYDGGAVLLEVIEDYEEPRTVKLDKDALKRGLELMPKVAPRHWQDFVNENDDAETGDVFIQLCVLGEVVYG
jgi:hypothetical protein